MRRITFPYHEPTDDERPDDEARRRRRRDGNASTDRARGGFLPRLL